MKRTFLPLCIMPLLFGCGDNEKATEQPAPTIFHVETADPIVNRELPFIRQQCPGLDKYAANFDDIKVEKDTMRPVTTIQFHIKDKNSIPGSYIASGHNCFLFIANDVHEVKISKSACQSVCFDKADVPGGDLLVKLDKEAVPMTADGKPPRKGCLMVYTPKPDADYWSCPR